MRRSPLFRDANERVPTMEFWSSFSSLPRTNSSDHLHLFSAVLRPINQLSTMEEDWCLVSDDEDFAIVASGHVEVECQPEPEPEPEARATPPSNEDNNNGDGSISLDDIDISTLLQDKLSVFAESDKQQVAERKAFSLSLLSPAHRSCRPIQARGRCVEVHHHNEAAISRKRNVKLVFCGEPRARSFPARLRAEMPSRRSALENGAMESPILTSLIVFTQDQGTQVDLDCDAAGTTEPSTASDDRSTRLESTLERSVNATNQMKAKSQEHERAQLKLMNAEALLESSDYRHQLDLFKLLRLESGLVLAKGREKLNSKIQEQLKAEIEELRKRNEELKRTNELLTGGTPAAFADQSIEDLEKLEISLSKGMDSVRAAIRSKYKEEIARKHENALCVACSNQPASVVLLPCRHQVLCSACALRVTTCPIDRKDIQDKVLTFGLDAYLG